MYVDIALVEWPDCPELGPRLLGRTSDSALVQAVREHLAAQRRRELAHLEPPVQLVPGPDGEGGEKSPVQEGAD